MAEARRFLFWSPSPPSFQKFAQKPGCLAAREAPRCDCQAGFVSLEQDLLENLECSRGENSPFSLNLIQFSADRRESFTCYHSEWSLFINPFSSSELTFESGGFSCILWHSTLCGLIERFWQGFKDICRTLTSASTFSSCLLISCITLHVD